MRALIVAAGRAPSAKLLLERARGAGLVICADGGAAALNRAGIMPHVMLGDFDSVAPSDLSLMRGKGVEIAEMPAHKDLTDLMAAYDLACERGAESVEILGALGGRLDHILGNVQVLIRSVKRVPAKILDDGCEAFASDSKVEICCAVGDTISVIPVMGEAVAVRSFGLEYGFERLVYTPYGISGVSNVAVAERAGFTLISGMAVVIRSWG